jgi:hypothetical protein
MCLPSGRQLVPLKLTRYYPFSGFWSDHSGVPPALQKHALQGVFIHRRKSLQNRF